MLVLYFTYKEYAYLQYVMLAKQVRVAYLNSLFQLRFVVVSTTRRKYTFGPVNDKWVIKYHGHKSNNDISRAMHSYQWLFNI